MADDVGGEPACWSHLFEHDDVAAGGVVDLNAAGARTGPGVIWSAPPGRDLNVNLARLPAGESIAEHRNDELDVLIVVLSGEGEITVEGEHHRVSGQQLLLIPAGARRAIGANRFDLVYLSIHRARGPLQIKR